MHIPESNLRFFVSLSQNLPPPLLTRREKQCIYEGGKT